MSPSLTADQLVERRTYLGGTDMAALAGVNPPNWTQPIGVWLEKTGQAVERPTSALMAEGHLFEPLICDLFSAATGHRLRAPGRTIRDRRRPYLAANIDRYAAVTAKCPPELQTLGDGILEAKKATDPHQWGATGSTDVPPHYAVQVQHYLGVTGRPVAYIAVLLPRADFRWYTLPRDDETINVLRELADRFWTENVLAGVPPEPDGSNTYTEWLQTRYRHDGTEAVATEAQVLWVEQIQDRRRQVARLEREIELTRQQLMESLGATTRLVLPFDRVVRYSGYDRKTTQWQTLARHLVRAQLDAVHPGLPEKEVDDRLAELATDYTTTKYIRPLVMPDLEE